MEPGQVMEESYTVEEEPQELPPVVSVETSEDGTTRRTETTVPEIDYKKNCRIRFFKNRHQLLNIYP